MQTEPRYDDVVREVCAFLAERIAAARAAGVEDKTLAIDPGLGFGKTMEHNWALLAGLRELTALRRPVLVGASRKRFLGALCDRPVGDRMAASLAAAVAAVERGATIIRAHDVKETCDVVQVADKLLKTTQGMDYGSMD